MEINARQFRVPQIYGDYWFNSDPVPVGAMGGYVLLIDFWDYTNLRCLQSLPYLREWDRRYREFGLVTIGVHTPQFPFAVNPMNVRAAVEDLLIRYPVVMDNSYAVWNAFRNQFWPTRYLVDKAGYLRYMSTGESAYQNFEHAIQSLLQDAGYHAEFPFLMEPVREIDRPGAVCFRSTPDILAGWQRGTIGNIEGFSPESTVHYEDPGVYLPGRVYLDGNWLNDRNFLRLNDPAGRGGHFVISYEAKEMTMVIKPEGESNFQVFVQQDDAYLPAENMGEDMRRDEEGRSYFVVEKARLYRLINNREYGEHTLRLSCRSNGFAFYSVSFVSAVMPETIGKT
ncbi:MAG TPA: hypothetical protein VMW43_00605 [Bacteroidota bacterium]|nr:hypothetical protein [Bacteroidota bacterium]